MRDYNDPLEAAAEYICLELHPVELRSKYAEHVTIESYADHIVYVLQELSTGMTAIFLGLLTNYLYDKVKNKHREKQAKELKSLMAEQQKKISELEKLLRKRKYKTIKANATITLNFHKDVLIKVKGNDPAINQLLSEALIKLEIDGKDALLKHVDSYNESLMDIKFHKADRKNRVR